MPYEVVKSNQCPAHKPWAVRNKETGKIHGCMESEETAKSQMRALYNAENKK